MTLTITATNDPTQKLSIEDGGMARLYAEQAATLAANFPGNTPQQFGALGDGVTDDLAAFTALNAAGGLVYLPKPSVRYLLSAPIDLTDCQVTVDPSANWDELTDGGDLTWTTVLGGWTDAGASRVVNPQRLGDRVFVGSASDEFAGNTTTGDEGTSWWGDTANASAYLPINATFLSIANHTPYAGVFLARGTDVNGGAPIAAGISVVNDIAGQPGWAIITEVQREGTAANTYGWEIGAKDKGSAHTTLNSYNNGSGVFGIWAAGGGANTQGGAATQPANAFAVILKNADSGLSGGGWSTGLVFTADALDGANGEAGDSGSAVAINMARRHAIDWGAPKTGGVVSTSGTPGLRIQSLVDDSNNSVHVTAYDNSIYFLSGSGTTFFGTVNSGSDYPTLRSSTGQARLDGSGPSTNIDIYFVPKGSGVVKFGTHTDIGSESLSGYITIKDAGGTTRKLAVVS